MAQSYGVGVVGLGFGAAVHLPAWLAEPRTRVLGLCGLNPERSKKKAKECGVNYLSWDEMLADPQIQIISLSVPPSQQPALIGQAAAAGKHLFCEKPLGANLEDARRAYEAVEKARVVAVVNHFFSALTTWREAKRCLPLLGGLRHAHLSWLLLSRAFAGGAKNWKTVGGQGGGSLYNFASHCFHYLEWLFGPVKTIYARATAFPEPEILAGAHLILGMSSGLTVSVSVAADSIQGSGHRLEVYGEKGAMTLLNNSGDFARGFSLQLSTSEGSQELATELLAGEGDGRLEIVKRMFGEFVDGLELGEQRGPGLAESLRVQTLLQAADQSLLQAREVEVANV